MTREHKTNCVPLWINHESKSKNTPGAANPTCVPLSVRGRICYYCFNIGPKGSKMQCSTCKVTNYCNAKCQKADWKHHRTICVRRGNISKEQEAEILSLIRPPPKPNSIETGRSAFLGYCIIRDKKIVAGPFRSVDKATVVARRMTIESREEHFVAEKILREYIEV